MHNFFKAKQKTWNQLKYDSGKDKNSFMQALARKEQIRGGVHKNLSNFSKLKSKSVYLSQLRK